LIIKSMVAAGVRRRGGRVGQHAGSHLETELDGCGGARLVEDRWGTLATSLWQRKAHDADLSCRPDRPSKRETFPRERLAVRDPAHRPAQRPPGVRSRRSTGSATSMRKSVIAAVETAAAYGITTVVLNGRTKNGPKTVA
jgi:hypothetical protein